MPSNITLEDVNKEKDFANVESVVDVAYDEAGNRLWYSVDNRVRNEKWTEVTLAGVGVFKSQDVDAANSAYELVRQDLVAGAYRDASGKAHFPVLDAQGSVRGYVTKSGLESAYDYYPYGTVVEVSPNAGDDNKRWQSKEFDNEHGKYYFGSRYFDPFFGMWISPDPAGQFANPYSYGGDPLNYIDPTGMWALGLGLVVGYDSNHGWSFGVGAAAEIGDVGINASLAFNQDGSKSLNLGANASIPVFNTGWWINAGVGFNLNSYMGASLNHSAGVCYGVSSAACAGVEVGQSFSWNSQNGFGMSVYIEAYATFAGVRASGGREFGFFGAEGRGFYAGISGYGLHAQVSQNGGFSWGFQRTFYAANYRQEGRMKDLSFFGKTLYYVNGILLKAGGSIIRQTNTVDVWNAEALEESGLDEFTMLMHGNPKYVGDDRFAPTRRIGPEELAEMLKNGTFNYNGEKVIKLFACSTGGKTDDGSLNFAQRLANAMGVLVKAPTTDIDVRPRVWLGNRTTVTTFVDHDGIPDPSGHWEYFYPQQPRQLPRGHLRW